MDELSNRDPHPRASLKGKGREILLGEHPDAPPPSAEETAQASAQPVPLPEQPGHVDPAALKLTPDETEVLLDFSPDSPAYAAESSFPVETAAPSAPVKGAPVPFEAPAVTPDEVLLDWMREEPAVEEGEPFFIPEEYVPGDMGMGFTPSGVPGWPAETSVEAGINELEGTDVTPAQFEVQHTPDVEETGPAAGDALPLSEREPRPAPLQSDRTYQALPEVEALVPQQPEQWPGPLPVETGEQSSDSLPPASEVAAGSGVGGSLVADSDPASYGVADPFLANNKEFKRPSARVLFDDTSRADKDLLNLLVDDDRIRKLSQQIEALQEDLAQNVYGDRKMVDNCQKELLQASSLLLSSRENYDDARAIVYRIRADTNRQRKVEADIRRYRPLLLNYYVGWGIALIVLFLLKALFTGVTDAVGVGVAAALYYPMLLGIGGALISGYLILERHTTRLRDFDPLHISWYLFNPLLGGVMGLLMFLLASIANDDLLRGTANDAENAITYLLCVVAGMNQNSVLRQLNDLLKRFGKGNGG